MRNLISSYNRTMDMNSSIRSGTNIQFMIPLKKESSNENKERIAI
jgi:hypothetical protein